MTSDTIPLLGYIHSCQGSHKYPAHNIGTMGYVWLDRRAAPADQWRELLCYSPSIHLLPSAHYGES